MLAHNSAVVALSDTLSLALCGGLSTPLQVEAPGRTGGTRTLQIMARSAHAAELTLLPWPFRADALVVEGEARPMPASGRLADEAELRTWLTAPERVAFRARLTPG